MTSELQQIKDSYESLEMTPEQISEDRDLDLVAVKAALMQFSSVYRKACGKELDEDTLNFSDEQLQRANEVIFELAMGAESEDLRFKAATYVRDDKKGRKEVVKAIQGLGNINFLQINQMLQESRESMNRVLGPQLKQVKG